MKNESYLDKIKQNCFFKIMDRQILITYAETESTTRMMKFMKYTWWTPVKTMKFKPWTRWKWRFRNFAPKTSKFSHIGWESELPEGTYAIKPDWVKSESVGLVNDHNIGWQNWNPLSHPNAMLAPHARSARQSGEILNYSLSH